MVSWSIVMILMGIVRSGKGLAIARFFLGIAEGGLFPGINYMLVCVLVRNVDLTNAFFLTDVLVRPTRVLSSLSYSLMFQVCSA